MAEILAMRSTAQEVGCKFVRTDPNKEDFDIFKVVDEIFRYIKQSIKKTLLSNISTRLLALKFESGNIIK